MFKIGDKIRILPGYRECGQCSTEINLPPFTKGIICKSKHGNHWGINFGKEIARGHNCDRTCPDRYGQNLCEKHIQLLTEFNNVKPFLQTI